VPGGRDVVIAPRGGPRPLRHEDRSVRHRHPFDAVRPARPVIADVGRRSACIFESLVPRQPARRAIEMGDPHLCFSVALIREHDTVASRIERRPVGEEGGVGRQRCNFLRMIGGRRCRSSRIGARTQWASPRSGWPAPAPSNQSLEPRPVRGLLSHRLMSRTFASAMIEMLSLWRDLTPRLDARAMDAQFHELVWNGLRGARQLDGTTYHKNRNCSTTAPALVA